MSTIRKLLLALGIMKKRYLAFMILVRNIMLTKVSSKNKGTIYRDVMFYPQNSVKTHVTNYKIIAKNIWQFSSET